MSGFKHEAWMMMVVRFGPVLVGLIIALLIGLGVIPLRPDLRSHIRQSRATPAIAAPTGSQQ